MPDSTSHNGRCNLRFLRVSPPLPSDPVDFIDDMLARSFVLQRRHPHLSARQTADIARAGLAAEAAALRAIGGAA